MFLGVRGGKPVYVSEETTAVNVIPLPATNLSIWVKDLETRATLSILYCHIK